MSVDFLDVFDVLAIHTDQIERYGGERGVRDKGLLESAVEQARIGYGDRYLHDGILEMAAAYAFHLVCNHPFVDGNKRTGAVSSLVFLDINGIEIVVPKGAIHDVTTAIATGDASKTDVAEFFRSCLA